MPAAAKSCLSLNIILLQLSCTHITAKQVSSWMTHWNGWFHQSKGLQRPSLRDLCRSYSFNSFYKKIFYSIPPEISES